jgi:two-component system cell cycle sensor histidine kinase PleC
MQLTLGNLEIYSLILTILTFAMGFSLLSYRRQLDASEKNNLAKSFFIERLGYELRNSLNGVIGFSQMILSEYFGPINHKQKDRLNDIYFSGMTMQTMLNDFIDLSKGEAGKITLLESEFKIHDLLGNVLESFDSKIKANKIHLVHHVSHPNITVHADKIKIAQVLKNVIDNAIKFSDKGGQLTISDKKQRNGDLKLSISDSGKGMTLDQILEAFEFPDLNKQLSGPYGVGVGLPLAKLFIELHGGIIAIDSEKEIGTTVTVTIPNNRIIK